MFEEKIVRLEADLFMAIDFGADGCTAVYCEVRKLADGTLLVEEFGRLLNHKTMGVLNGSQAHE